jgi:hypothetical protein
MIENSERLQRAWLGMIGPVLVLIGILADNDEAQVFVDGPVLSVRLAPAARFSRT